jgi:hypothetical protein
LSSTINLDVFRALIRSITTYACPTWEIAEDSHLMQEQRMQNRAFGATGDLDRSQGVRNLQLTKCTIT